MSRSLRLLETSLVSAFVSFGIAAAVLHATEPAPVVGATCDSEDVLTPLLRTAIEADVALGSGDCALDDVEASRAESLYRWYADEHEKLADSSTLEWAQTRANALRQVQVDLKTMKALEAEAMALEAFEKQEE